jgi:hypothetical protein
VKGLLAMKMDPNTSQTQNDLTVEIERTVQKCLDIKVAGNTTDYVNQTIEKKPSLRVINAVLLNMVVLFRDRIVEIVFMMSENITFQSDLVFNYFEFFE